jgi:hypothetical protein
MKGDIFSRLLQRPQMHQNLIFNTPRCKRRQFGSLVRRERLDRFDQADGSDADQIFHVFSGIVEFFDDMNKNRCNSTD